MQLKRKLLTETNTAKAGWLINYTALRISLRYGWTQRNNIKFRVARTLRTQLMVNKKIDFHRVVIGMSWCVFVRNQRKIAESSHLMWDLLNFITK